MNYGGMGVWEIDYGGMSVRIMEYGSVIIMENALCDVDCMTKP